MNRDSEYDLACSPPLSDRALHMRRAGDDAENLIFSNRKLVEFLGKLQQLPFTSTRSSNLSEKALGKIDQELERAELHDKRDKYLASLSEDIE